jgi:hypothetical protein
MSTIAKAAIKSGIEGFVNPDNSVSKKESYTELAAVLISFVISLIILSLIGKLLWNGIIVDLFTCVRPAKSYWQILGLFVFLSLIIG